MDLPLQLVSDVTVIREGTLWNFPKVAKDGESSPLRTFVMIGRLPKHFRVLEDEGCLFLLFKCLLRR
jgi:hypothetical protein